MLSVILFTAALLFTSLAIDRICEAFKAVEADIAALKQTQKQNQKELQALVEFSTEKEN